jgi:oxygen-independent coproporphyrinogen III oxidase
MDLIYGLPGLTLAGWEENLHITMEQPVTHISAYHLTYEPGTVFHHWKKKGKIS